MTGGNNQDGYAGNGSHVLPPRDDRETLSALLDGELPGDAARFAIRRLSHDVQWRETCGRWQLIGDAMRGEAVALAPHDFAAGVARALQYTDAATEAASAPGPARATPRGRWIGGAALAASLVVAAVLVVKPFTAPTTAQPVPVAAEAATPRVTPPVPAAPAAPASNASSSQALLAGGGEAAAAPPAQGAAAPVSTARSPVRPSPARSAPRPASASLPATAVAATEAPAGPFQPPAHEIASRPWPRAVLPGASAAGGLTVGFEEAVASPSQAFYPFEPQPSPAAGQDGDASTP